MYSEKGIYIRLIKGFKFPEPVFIPESLKIKFKFLAEPVEILKRINQMGKSRYAWEIIQNIGQLKPIRNPWIKYDQFWEPFQHTLSSQSQELGIRMYPFQITPLPHNQIDTHIKKTLFENIINTKVESVNSQYQIRLYPPGIGTVHLIIYVKLPIIIDIQKILNILLKRRFINASFITIDHSQLDFSNWAERIYSRLLKQISDHKEEKRDIHGDIGIINLLGNFPTQEIRQVLEYNLEKEGNSTFLERNSDDIIYLSKNLVFLYIDTVLAKFRRWKYLTKPEYIFHGRRCMRGHIVNVTELGYCSAYLLKFYNSVANNLFGIPKDSSWIYTLNRMLNIPSYLEKELWKNIYACELYKQGINKDFMTILDNSLKQIDFSASEHSFVDDLLTKLIPLSQSLMSVADIFAKLK